MYIYIYNINYIYIYNPFKNNPRYVSCRIGIFFGSLLNAHPTSLRWSAIPDWFRSPQRPLERCWCLFTRSRCYPLRPVGEKGRRILQRSVSVLWVNSIVFVCKRSWGLDYKWSFTQEDIFQDLCRAFADDISLFLTNRKIWQPASCTFPVFSATTSHPISSLWVSWCFDYADQLARAGPLHHLGCDVLQGLFGLQFVNGEKHEQNSSCLVKTQVYRNIFI